MACNTVLTLRLRRQSQSVDSGVDMRTVRRPEDVVRLETPLAVLAEICFLFTINLQILF